MIRTIVNINDFRPGTKHIMIRNIVKMNVFRTGTNTYHDLSQKCTKSNFVRKQTTNNIMIRTIVQINVCRSGRNTHDVPPQGTNVESVITQFSLFLQY